MGRTSDLISCLAAGAFLVLCLVALVGGILPERKQKGGPRCDD